MFILPLSLFSGTGLCPVDVLVLLSAGLHRLLR